MLPPLHTTHFIVTGQFLVGKISAVPRKPLSNIKSVANFSLVLEIEDNHLQTTLDHHTNVRASNAFKYWHVEVNTNPTPAHLLFVYVLT